MAQYARWEEEGWEVWSVLFLIPNTDNQEAQSTISSSKPWRVPKKGHCLVSFPSSCFSDAGLGPGEPCCSSWLPRGPALS
jgi:hypothetical protein